MLRRGLLTLALAAVASAAFATSYVVPPDDVLVGKAESIVRARATANWVEDTHERGIETVTEFTVEDTLKGSVPHAFRVRVPGGIFGKAAKLVPGMPQFIVGEQTLLFLNRRADTDDYMTTDVALGHFAFKDDSVNGRLAIRDQEIFGWDLKTNAEHRETRRIAQKFIEYIRAIANGRPAQPDYFVPDHPSLHAQPNSTGPTLRLAPLACSFPSTCAAAQYTLSFYVINSPPCNTGNTTNDANCAETGPGGRWAVFDTSAVNWNQGNTETNATNGGTDAINAAFGAWNGDPNSNVNYVLTSNTPNTNGIFDTSDGVNNIVFEKSIPGQLAFSCVTGGLLGQGGVTLASGSHTFAGATFFTNVEGDVSMNQGVGACIGQNPGITQMNFNRGLAHEVGHTLGFRHADKARSHDPITGVEQLCTTFSTYDCGSADLMTAQVTTGTTMALGTFDTHAVESLYPSTAPAPVTGVEAHTTTSTNVQVSWTGSCATTCHIYRSADHLTYTLLNPSITVTGTTYNDSTASATTAYLYKVRVFNGSESADSNIDLATTVIYTNTIVSGSTIQAVDTNQMRDAIDAVRALDGLGRGNYTFGSGAPVRVTSSDVVRKTDMDQMRQNLDTAYFALFGVHPSYTNGTITQNVSIVSAIDFNEIRNWMR